MSKMSFGQMQQEIYKFVLDKLWPKPCDVKLATHFLAIESDTYWVEEFDDVYAAVNKNDYEELLDALNTACTAVVSEIQEWYDNPYNFAPGYIKVSVPDLLEVPEKDLKKLANAIDPDIFASYKQKLKLSKLAHAKRQKIEARAFKEHIPGILSIIEKNDLTGWKRLLKSLSKPLYNNEMREYFSRILKNDTRKVNKIMKSSSPEEMKKWCKKYLPPYEYCDCVICNLHWIKNEHFARARYNKFIKRMIAKNLA